MKVAEFASYLSMHGLVDVTKIPEDSDEGFANRTKIQNYAFLARSFGLDMGYVFNGHLNDLIHSRWPMTMTRWMRQISRAF